MGWRPFSIVAECEREAEQSRRSKSHSSFLWGRGALLSFICLFFPNDFRECIFIFIFCYSYWTEPCCMMQLYWTRCCLPCLFTRAGVGRRRTIAWRKPRNLSSTREIFSVWYCHNDNDYKDDDVDACLSIRIIFFVQFLWVIPSISVQAWILGSPFVETSTFIQGLELSVCKLWKLSWMGYSSVLSQETIWLSFHRIVYDLFLLDQRGVRRIEFL